MPSVDCYTRLGSLYSKDSIYAQEHKWTHIVASALLAFGHEAQVVSLCDVILHDYGDDLDGAVTSLAQLREALLKASPLVGFPRSIIAMTSIQSHLKAHHATIAERLSRPKDSLRSDVPLEERYERGKQFFSQIYSKHTDKILETLNAASGGDLGEYALTSVYGDLLAETRGGVGLQETTLIEFVCCLALNVPDQAKGHMYGARNLGNSGAELRASVAIVKDLASELGVSWKEDGMPFLSKLEEW